MPVYVYICQTCKQQVEIEQKITDPPIEFCKFCDESPYSDSTGPIIGKLKKVLQPTTTIFKVGFQKFIKETH